MGSPSNIRSGQVEAVQTGCATNLNLVDIYSEWSSYWPLNFSPSDEQDYLSLMVEFFNLEMIMRFGMTIGAVYAVRLESMLSC